MKKNIQDLLNKRKSKFKDYIVFCNDLELIIEDLAKELDLPKKEIKKVVDSEFRILDNIIKNEGLIKEDSEFEAFKSIRIPILGSFRPSEKKFKHLQKYVKDKKNV